MNHLDERYDGERPDILDNAYVIVEFANGVRGCLDLCMFAEASRNEQELCAVGARGQGRGVRARRHRARRRPRRPARSARSTPRRNADVRYEGFHHGASYLELAAFADAVRTGARPRSRSTTATGRSRPAWPRTARSTNGGSCRCANSFRNSRGGPPAPVGVDSLPYTIRRCAVRELAGLAMATSSFLHRCACGGSGVRAHAVDERRERQLRYRDQAHGRRVRRRRVGRALRRVRAVHDVEGLRGVGRARRGGPARGARRRGGVADADERDHRRGARPQRGGRRTRRAREPEALERPRAARAGRNGRRCFARCAARRGGARVRPAVRRCRAHSREYLLRGYPGRVRPDRRSAEGRDERRSARQHRRGARDRSTRRRPGIARSPTRRCAPISGGRCERRRRRSTS